MLLLKFSSSGTPQQQKIYGTGNNAWGTERFRTLVFTNDMAYLYAGAKQGGESDGSADWQAGCVYSGRGVKKRGANDAVTTTHSPPPTFAPQTGPTTYDTTPPTTIDSASREMVYMKLDAGTLEPIWVSSASITNGNGEIYMTSMKADSQGNLIMAGTMTNRTLTDGRKRERGLSCHVCLARLALPFTYPVPPHSRSPHRSWDCRLRKRRDAGTWDKYRRRRLGRQGVFHRRCAVGVHVHRCCRLL